VLTLFLQAALLTPAADVPAPVAMVLTTKGAVTLQAPKARPRRLGAMDLLRPGDQIRAAAKAEAVMVFFADGHRERLKPKAEATVGEKGCTPAGAVETQKAVKLPPAHLRSLRELARSGRAAVGVPRGDAPDDPQVVIPMFGAVVLTDHPALSWPPAAKAKDYEVQLLSGPEGKSQRVIWKATTKETRLCYPEKREVLGHAKLYRWRVIARMGEDKEETVVKSKFHVATKGECAKLASLKPLIESKDSTDLLLAAATYEAHGVHDEVLALYQRVAKLVPEEPNFQVALANYYERAGRKELAREARERAQALRSRPAE
jgi:hypothetical protein